ncbi:MAG: DUF2029 domain-containing protein [Rhizobiaceae bacterium]|nr:MAG: DUF2029 domain-containing protein [Rhizobiaceae bacterium]CAG1012736.1 hypothetical protein RHIZO_04322 [Rhizobiaceae bacterium]
MRFFSELAPPYRVVAIVATALLAVHVGALARALVDPAIPAGIANKDFVNYWMAGHLVREGRVMDLFGPHPVYFAHLTEAFGAGFPWHNWSYPPHYLLLVWPLGFFTYEVAMGVFLAATGALFLLALRNFAREAGPMVWVAAGPFIAHNFWAAQNGYFSAALGLSALALRERRPVLAGVLLGVLTVKPQLGLLFPFLLIAERRWSMIASAALTTVALVGASAAIFGVEAWKGYLDEVVPYQALVMRALEGTFLAMMPSPFGALRSWQFGADIALPLHLLVAVPVALATIVAFFRVADDRTRTVLFLLATFIVTPYALSYDLGMLVAALALLATDGPDGSSARVRAALLAVAMLLPVLMIPLGNVGFPPAPVVLLAVYALALAEAAAANRKGQPRAFSRDADISKAAASG